MRRAEMLAALDELFYLSPGTLTGSEKLKDIESWDSLAVVSFIALIDEKCNVTLSPDAIAKCQSVDDLVNLGNGAD